MGRVSARSDALLDIVKKHERKGIPLVIEGFHEHDKWPANMFTLEGFSGHSDSQGILTLYLSLSSDSSDISDFQKFVFAMYTQGQTKPWI